MPPGLAWRECGQRGCAVAVSQGHLPAEAPARGSQPRLPAAAQSAQSAAAGALEKEAAMAGLARGTLGATLGCCHCGGWGLERGHCPWWGSVGASSGMGHGRDGPAPATNRLNVILFHTPKKNVEKKR